MPVEITSTKNPRLKFLVSLQNAKERKASRLFSIEGVREISLAQQSGFSISSLIICTEIYKEDSAYPISLSADEILHVPETVFAKIAYRGSTGGVIAIARTKALSLSDLKCSTQSLFLILEKIEKPGNLGAMLRTADAAGVSGVIIADPSTDVFNPNVVRSSIGCLFTVPVAIGQNEDVLNWCRKNEIRTYAASLEARSIYTQVDLTKSCAIVLGSEADGLSPFWLSTVDEKIIIPMRGKIDSMNVSNAAAVLIFEAVRQRQG